MNFFHKVVAWYRRPKSHTADFFESLLIIIPLAFLIRTFVFSLYKVPTCSMETTMLPGEIFLADKITPFLGKLKYGDIIAMNDPLYQYSKNPIVKLWQQYVWGPDNWTKRIIGLPGDHIKGVIEDGKPVVYRNDKKLDEPYLNKYPIILTFDPHRSTPGKHMSYDPDLPLDKQPYFRMTPYEVNLGKRVSRQTGEPYLRYPGTPNPDKGMFGPRKGAPVFDEFDVHLGPNEYWGLGDNRLGSTDCRAWGPINGKYIHAKVIYRLFSHDDLDENWMIFDILKHPIDFFKRIRWDRCFNILK